MEIIFVVSVLAVMLFILIKEYFPPDVTLFTTMSIFLLSGIISVEEAFEGFSNDGVITIGLLFIISYSVFNSGTLQSFIKKYLRTNNKLSMILLKLMIPVSSLSAFLNNTPIVAMFTPVVRNWAVRNNIPPSKLLIPLSYATILGGTITLIGTSTNLMINGLLKQNGYQGFTLFEFSFIGIPLTIIGILYMITIGKHILPKVISTDMLQTIEDSSKRYIFEVYVSPDSHMVGKTVNEANLRKLNNIFLIQIYRSKQIISPVPHDELIQSSDLLIFSGHIDGINTLLKNGGISLKTESNEFITQYKSGKSTLIEAVISHNSPLLNIKVKESNFRSIYNASIIAIQRNTKKYTSGIGNHTLKPGDTILLLTKENFIQTWANSRDFYLLVDITPKKPTKPTNKFIISFVLLGMIGLVVFNIFSILKAALISVVILLLTKSISPSDARKSVDWSIIILMASAIGIGSSVEQSGLTDIISLFIIHLYGVIGIYGIAILIYLFTTILTELIHNLAAAAMMFPIGLSVAVEMGIDPKIFAMLIAISASCSFITPIGYSTNLIVYGPGGYRFSDYAKVGSLLSIICMLCTVLITLSIWR
ncbi:SLC13 family permease [Bacillus sp. J37]|uniref:SLC13 family permease n=1 Tax=Bacillus sp. J37 TaxID=935837 RepID=UPI0004AEB7E0|nr:SLC13 family permease [Bacillus sp. J37]